MIIVKIKAGIHIAELSYTCMAVVIEAIAHGRGDLVSLNDKTWTYKNKLHYLPSSIFHSLSPSLVGAPFFYLSSQFSFALSNSFSFSSFFPWNICH